jgi:hypothetical protein
LPDSPPVPTPPWTASWSGEQAFRLRPSADFPGLLELDQQEAQGEGEPLFTVIHLNRHRRAMIDLLCHVCGQPTDPADRFIFPAASGGLVTLHDGSQQYGCNVSPMHFACAQRAARDCAHLAKVREPPLRCSDDAGRLIHRTDVTPGLEAIAAQLPTGVQVVFSCYRLYDAPFTQAVIAAREGWEARVRARRQ